VVEGTTGLDASVRLGRGRLDLAVDLHVDPGTTVAVLGPNGAGKTSLLRVVAGLLALEDGSVRVDGVDWDRAETGRRLAPEARSVGFVFQDYLLFPHLDARQNVAFGLRSRGRNRPEAAALADEWLDRVGLAGRARSRPAQLSGGEAQRVALARALAPAPRLLLLDEPLAALDAGTRVDLRRELGRHLAAIPGSTLVITHDPVDALALADRVVVLEEGRVVQAGTIADVTRRPRSSYVARLIGTNLLRGQARGHRLVLDGAELTLADEAQGPSLAVIAPAAVSLHTRAPEGSPRNQWEATVGGLERLGDRVRVQLIGPVPLVAEVTPGAVADLGLVDGRPVWAVVKATEIATYPA
jgi:molybdate transport system ATP-binding protein